MSKFDEALAKYEKQLESMGMEYDADLLRKITKGLGPSIYNRDSSTVACSDANEVARVKESFLMKKMGMTDEEEAETAVEAVCAKYKGTTKYRAIFYYMLVKDLKFEDKYA